MKKIIFVIIISICIFVGCSTTQVEENKNSHIVEPNVKEEPSTYVPQPTPTTPTYVAPTPSYTTPTTPTYVAPTPSYTTPTTPTYVAPTPSYTTPTVPQTPPTWSGTVTQATGNCALDLSSGKNPVQAKLMARRGAMVEAQRNLLEQVMGTQLDSKTYVKDMIAESDEIHAQLQGVIRGAEVISENFDGSMYTVVMGLKMYNVYEFLKSRQIYYK
jgi:hypothetical protein